MTPDNTTQLVLVLVGAALAFGAIGWAPYGRTVGPPLSVAALAAAALVAAVADELAAGRVATTVLVVLTGGLAVVGGGPLTTRIFAVVDRRNSARQTLDQAGDTLRGGAWIGALERLAVFAGLAAGFPEGVAVVLALKGVGRFPDLRSDDGRGAATERFIIGTFASVLWAAGCAGMVALVRR
jgi:hypothetical protein